MKKKKEIKKKIETTKKHTNLIHKSKKTVEKANSSGQKSGVKTIANDFDYNAFEYNSSVEKRLSA